MERWALSTTSCPRLGGWSPPVAPALGLSFPKPGDTLNILVQEPTSSKKLVVTRASLLGARALARRCKPMRLRHLDFKLYKPKQIQMTLSGASRLKDVAGRSGRLKSRPMLFVMMQEQDASIYSPVLYLFLSLSFLFLLLLLLLPLSLSL